MTLEEALRLINAIVSPSMPAYRMRELLDGMLRGAAAISEIMDAGMPCGMEDPPIVSLGNGTCGVLVDDRGDALTPDELRGYAVRLLHIADIAEERNR